MTTFIRSSVQGPRIINQEACIQNSLDTNIEKHKRLTIKIKKLYVQLILETVDLHDKYIYSHLFTRSSPIFTNINNREFFFKICQVILKRGPLLLLRTLEDMFNHHHMASDVSSSFKYSTTLWYVTRREGLINTMI